MPGECCQHLWFYGHSSTPRDVSGKPDEGGEVAGFLFVAGGDTATVSDAAKEAFDDISMLATPTIIGFFAFAGRVLPGLGWMQA